MKARLDNFYRGIKKYVEIFKLRFKSIWEYKFNFVFSIFRPFMELGVILIIWVVVWNFVDVGDKAFFLAYLTIANLFSTNTFTWIGLEAMIKGFYRYDLSILLSKPLSVVLNFYARQLSWFFISFFGFFPVLVFLIVFFKLSFVNFILLLNMLILVNLLSFLIIFAIDSLAFWVKGAWGIRYCFYVVQKLFSGALLPLFLFPKKFLMLLDYFPFKFFGHVPAFLILGKFSSFECLALFLILGLWIFVSGLVAIGIFSLGLRKYESHGG